MTKTEKHIGIIHTRGTQRSALSYRHKRDTKGHTESHSTAVIPFSPRAYRWAAHT